MRRDMIPLAAGLSLFALGFGVLSVMYAVMDPSPELPGLYSFRSATIGDGVLLPLLMFISLSSMARFQRIVAPRPRPAIGAGLVGALVGLGTQVQWLRDDHTVLNWTIPHQHEFNAAGWYHAVFLVTACALLTGTATGALLQIRDLLRTTGPASHSEIWTPYLLGILITIVGFVGLLFLDNAEIGGWGATSLAVVLVLLAVTLGVLVWAIFGMARPGERLFVWIATTSVAVAISMLFWHGPVLTIAQILALAVA